MTASDKITVTLQKMSGSEKINVTDKNTNNSVFLREFLLTAKYAINGRPSYESTQLIHIPIQLIRQMIHHIYFLYLIMRLEKIELSGFFLEK